MAEMFRRLLWFFIVSSTLAYALFLLAGSVIHAQSIDQSRMVVARDTLQPGVHNLSGILMVHSSCAELSVRTEQQTNNTYLLSFTTWNEPSVSNCIQEDTPRSFHALVFAPSTGIHFNAVLDNQPLFLSVIPYVDTTH